MSRYVLIASGSGRRLVFLGEAARGPWQPAQFCRTERRAVGNRSRWQRRRRRLRNEDSGNGLDRVGLRLFRLPMPPTLLMAVWICAASCFSWLSGQRHHGSRAVLAIKRRPIRSSGGRRWRRLRHEDSGNGLDLGRVKGASQAAHAAGVVIDGVLDLAALSAFLRSEARGP